MIRREAVPERALHARYAREGAYLDCYACDVERAVSHAEFVAAFYTTWLFRLERWILSWAVNKPSTDEQARELAAGRRLDFAAWSVEARCTDQLLLSDFRNVTRSWLMVEALGATTRLYFGSVVTTRPNARTGQPELGRSYRLLLGFHKLYSRQLLAAARRKLRRRPLS